MDIDIQLTPYSDTGTPPPTHSAVERKLKQGQLKICIVYQQGLILKMGRQVLKEGQVQTKANDHGLDIWFVSKVVSRHHAEIWAKDGQLYIRDVGSSSGSFLNKMRLSPSGKGSRPYPLKDGDVLQFGVDYKGKSEDIFKSIVLKVGFIDQWAQLRRKQANPVKFQTALRSLLLATNPYASSSTSAPTEDSNASTECCICINTIGPYQALFISPCSHCFHFKCVSSILSQSQMFPCPIQVANLTASVSMESIASDIKESADNSDSDVSVTVDEQGAAIQTHPSNTAIHIIPTSRPIAVPVVVKPKRVAETPVTRPMTAHGDGRPGPSTAVTNIIQANTVTNGRPRSADEGKQGKSLVSKISTFLSRKQNNSNTFSPSSPITNSGPGVVPDTYLPPIQSEMEISPTQVFVNAGVVVDALPRRFTGRASKSDSLVPENDLVIALNDITVEAEPNVNDRDDSDDMMMM